MNIPMIVIGAVCALIGLVTGDEKSDNKEASSAKESKSNAKNDSNRNSDGTSNSGDMGASGKASSGKSEGRSLGLDDDSSSE